MFTVEDVCNENHELEIVRIEGRESNDGQRKLYFHGVLRDVPDELKKYNVIKTAWMLGKQCHLIVIDCI